MDVLIKDFQHKTPLSFRFYYYINFGEKRGKIQNFMSLFPVQQTHFLLTIGRKEWTEVVRDA